MLKNPAYPYHKAYGIQRRSIMNPLRYGHNKGIVKLIVWLSWPIIILAKRLSSYPIIKWIINPFFAYPWNEVTAIPIDQEVRGPDSVVLPRRVVERLISEVREIFIVDECICRTKGECQNYPHDIGCIALGSAVSRMHPSQGHMATQEEAIAHVRRASEAGLIANVAHTWIDPVAFGLTRFSRLMFICFCDDCCCIFRTHMHKRGPNLDRACKGLPGVSVEVDPEKCIGCGTCVERCFVAAMELRDGIAVTGESCRGCARCVDICPQEAISLNIEKEDMLYENLVKRIRAVADIWG